MAMVYRKCLQCGTKAWHNACGKAERQNGRCTYCGHPADVGNSGGFKRDYAKSLMDRQVNRARVLGLNLEG